MANSISICKHKCANDEEFWESVTQLIRIFTNQDYDVLLQYDDCGVYVLNIVHNPRGEDFGDDRFIKVTAEEEENLLWQREHNDKGEIEE